jgi:hypothetical protein
VVAVWLLMPSGGGPAQLPSIVVSIVVVLLKRALISSRAVPPSGKTVGRASIEIPGAILVKVGSVSSVRAAASRRAWAFGRPERTPAAPESVLRSAPRAAGKALSRSDLSNGFGRDESTNDAISADSADFMALVTTRRDWPTSVIPGSPRPLFGAAIPWIPVSSGS